MKYTFKNCFSYQILFVYNLDLKPSCIIIRYILYNLCQNKDCMYNLWTMFTKYPIIYFILLYSLTIFYWQATHVWMERKLYWCFSYKSQPHVNILQFTNIQSFLAPEEKVVLTYHIIQTIRKVYIKMVRFNSPLIILLLRHIGQPSLTLKPPPPPILACNCKIPIGI